MDVAKYKPLKGSSYIDLPQQLKLKKAIVNVQNKDQQCFKWSVLAALFPVDKDSQRVSKYTQHEDKLDWTGLTFPVSLQDIPKFERRNHISVNVYGFDVKTSVHLLQKSQLIDNKQHIDLLLLTKGAQSHYCWIKHFSRFGNRAITSTPRSTSVATVFMGFPPSRSWSST